MKFTVFTIKSSWAPENTWRSQGGQGQELRDYYIRTEEALPNGAEGFKVAKKADFQGYADGAKIAIVWKTDENGIQGRDDKQGRLWLQAQDKTYEWKKAAAPDAQTSIPGYKPSPGATSGPGRAQRPEPADQPPVSGKSVLSRLTSCKAYAALGSMHAYQAVGFSREEAFQLTLATSGQTGTSLSMRMEQDPNIVWDFRSLDTMEAAETESVANGVDGGEDNQGVPF